MKVFVAILLVAAVASVSGGAITGCQNQAFTTPSTLTSGAKRFAIGDHPDGGLADPTYCLRLDKFQGSGAWTASCPQGQVWLDTVPDNNGKLDVIISGKVSGGPDVGSTRQNAKCFDVYFHMGGCTISGSGTSTQVTCPIGSSANKPASYIKECGSDIATATSLEAFNGKYSYDFKIKFNHRTVSDKPSGYGWIQSTGTNIPGSTQYIDAGSRKPTKDWLFVVEDSCPPAPGPIPVPCTRYRWDWRQDCPGCGGTAVSRQQMGNIVMQYDTAGGNNPTDRYYLAVTFNAQQSSGRGAPAGFWLVVSDGENPKGDYAEYFMIYVCSGSDLASFYVYNGQNSVNTYSASNTKFGSPIFVGSRAVSRTVDGQGAITYSFTVDHTALYNSGLTQLTYRKNNGFPNIDLSQWDGAQFGNNPNRPNKVGVWFHTFGYDEGNPAQYCNIDQNTGKVISISAINNSYMDYQSKPSTSSEYNCGGPAPGPVPPNPPCDGLDCCGNCDDECHNPPAASGGMACMSTGMNSFKCTYSANTNKLYLDGDRIMNPNGGGD